MRFLIILFTLLLALAAPALAQQAAPPANPLIDYAGFEKLVREVGPLREARRLGWAQFAAKAHGKGAKRGMHARKADAGQYEPLDGIDGQGDDETDGRLSFSTFVLMLLTSLVMLF